MINSTILKMIDRKSVLWMRLLLVAGAFFLVVPQVKVNEKVFRSELLAPPAALKYFLFGQKYLASDIFWVRAIQDIDFCEEKSKEGLCLGTTWLFQTLNFITDLDPWYRMPYSAGSMALSVVISDREGATQLFDKALIYYSKDWVIAYKAAYHAVYEEKNADKGARLMERAAHYGAPSWVYSLATQLYTESGKKELGYRLYESLKNSGLTSAILDKMKEKLEK